MDHYEMSELIERSSLGTPHAKAMRRFARESDVAEVFRRLGYEPARPTNLRLVPNARSERERGVQVYHAGVQPQTLYCRRITWAEGESPVGGQVGIEITDDLTLWDEWIDDLPQRIGSDAVERIELYSSAEIEWGNDLAPQMARIMERHQRLLSSGEVARELGVSNATIQRYARDGMIPSSKTPGGHFRFNLGEVKAAWTDPPEIS